MNRSTNYTAKLIALEWWNGSGWTIEEVFGVECRVAQEFKNISVDVIGSSVTDGVDNAAHRATIFRRSVVCDYFEFLDRFHAKHLAAGATWSKVLRIVHVGPIKHEQIGSQARSAN